MSVLCQKPVKKSLVVYELTKYSDVKKLLTVHEKMPDLPQHIWYDTTYEEQDLSIRHFGGTIMSSSSEMKLVLN